MDRQTLETVNQLRAQRRAAMVITNLETGQSRLVEEGGIEDGQLADQAGKAFRTGKPATFEIDGTSHFLNVYLPPPRLVVIGAVHISQALAPMAHLAGYHMEVIDPRTAFATPERFQDVVLHADWPDDILKEQPLDRYCALAAVTHDPKIDDLPIKAALEADCFYVGALGSRKTHGKRLERLGEAGVADTLLKRIHAPIGLDIGAASPQEIAVAVLAEVIKAFRTREL